jgi:hypothetical protein
MSVLVDSDVLIEVSSGRDLDLIKRWAELGRQDVSVLYSPVSLSELWAGARPAEHDGIENLFRALTCLTIDDETGRRAGDYLRQFGKSHGVELGDALIAASAEQSRARLWTRNRKHYPMKNLIFY